MFYSSLRVFNRRIITCNFKQCRASFCHDAGSLLKVKDYDQIRRITLSDPKTRNSLSYEMVEKLLSAVQERLSDTSLRCIVIAAEGPVFSAGHNLKHLVNSEGKAVFGRFSELMLAMVRAPVPVISAVDGLAAAAGCQLVAQSDMVLCTSASSFSTPGANFGVFCSTPGVAVARALPQKVAAYMLFTGLPISAEQALSHGLVHKLSKDAKQLEEDLESVSNAICSKSRAVVSLGKKLFYKQIHMDLSSAYNLASEGMLSNLDLYDGNEGLKSFIEKRKPVWDHTNRKK